MENDKVNSTKKRPKKLWLVIIIILVVLALIIGAFFLGKFFTGKSLKLVSKNSPALSPSPSLKVTIKPSQTQTPTPTPEEETVPEGKKIFRNEDYGYQVYYPADATIKYAVGATDAGLKSDKVCVVIENSYMYVAISASENTDGKYVCLRSGVGADEISNTPEQINVLGKTYTAQGFMFSSVSMRILRSDWMFELDDGTDFDYGINLNPDTYKDPGEIKAHAEARAIVESFKEL